MPETLTTIEEHACFGGTVGSYGHHSSACDAEMRFAVYVSPQAAEGPVLVLYYLAGLTSIALKNPDRNRSVSAFAPIAAPTRALGQESVLRLPRTKSGVGTT